MSHPRGISFPGFKSQSHFYPHSTYSKALDPQTRKRAARRLFRLAWKRYSRLFARIAARAWQYRGQSRCERCVDGNVALRVAGGLLRYNPDVAGTSTLPSGAASDIT